MDECDWSRKGRNQLILFGLEVNDREKSSCVQSEGLATKWSANKGMD